MAGRPLEAKGWLKVSARRASYGPVNRMTKKRDVEKVRITSVTVSKPSVDEDEEAVEITLEFPSDYFDIANPRVTVVVQSPDAPADVRVTADVTKGRSPSAAAKVART